MTAGSHDFEVETGSTWTRTISAVDNDSNAIDHTGYTVVMDVRVNSDSTSEFITLTAGNGRVSINGDGDIVLTISAADTADLTPGDYVYDLKVTDTSSSVQYYLRGNFKVIDAVTD